MNKQDHALAFKKLQTIPGVGKAIAQDLYDLGYRSVSDLQNENPEEMYDRACILQQAKIDRCLLYVFRCAVYFASHTRHAPEKLKWWNWQDM